MISHGRSLRKVRPAIDRVALPIGRLFVGLISEWAEKSISHSWTVLGMLVNLTPWVVATLTWIEQRFLMRAKEQLNDYTIFDLQDGPDSW